MTRASTRRSVRRGAAVALALGLSAPGSVAATWTETVISATTQFDEPSLALDAADRSHLAYVGYGDAPGIYSATDATGRWVSTRLTTTTDDAPAIALDADGNEHIVFVRSGADPGILYATDATGDWVVSRLTSEPADSPSIAIDLNGRVHIAFDSGSFDPGIVSLDDTTGTWVRAQVTAAHLDGATSIVVLPDGSSRIAFARYAPEEPGIYVATAAAPAGPWSVERLTSAYDDEPSMAIRSPDAVDLAFVRFQSTGRGLYHAIGTGSWAVDPLVLDADRSFDRPSIAIGRDGLAMIAYSVADSNGDASGLALATQRADGSWESDRSLTDSGRPDDWPSLALDGANGRHVAFAELDTGPNPGVYVRDPVRFDLVAASTVDSDVSMTELGDDHVIAFGHVSAGADRAIRTGRDTGGIWAFENAAKDPSPPAVVIDDARHTRIFGGDTELSDATGSWRRSTLGLDAHDVRASRDPSGGTVLSYQDETGAPAIASDRSGSWRTAANYIGVDGLSAVASDAGGGLHWVIAGEALLYQSAPALEGPWSEKRLGDHATDPTIAVDAAGKVHIVWRRTTSDEGTYYTTDATGSWVTTRLTRTSAEGAPALALDGTGRVYVAVVRTGRAANPGLYLVSNRTGRWVTKRIDGAFDDMAPQLAVDPSGHATIVLGRVAAGLRAFEETGRASTGTGRPSGIREIDLRDPDPRRPDPVSPDSSSPATVPNDHGVDPIP